MPASSLTVIAPAKVNLYLHVTGRRDDGYHLLDSLVVFADVADQISIHAASQFSFAIEGAYAPAFTAADRDQSPQGTNLVVRAAYACAAHFERPLNVRITLAKNIPLASGVGGGSANAAAVIWGLIRFWGIKPPPLSSMMPLLLGLGADVPVCYLCQGAHVSGAGEILQPSEHLPEWPALLVNPRQSCPTPEIFRNYRDSGQTFTKPVMSPEDLSERGDFLSFIKRQANDLEMAAIEKIPVIKDVMSALKQSEEVQLMRMSGSGATVFALYPTPEAAQRAAEAIQFMHPSWWVRSCTLNQVVRY